MAPVLQQYEVLAVDDVFMCVCPWGLTGFLRAVGPHLTEKCLRETVCSGNERAQDSQPRGGSRYNTGFRAVPEAQLRFLLRAG